MATARQYLESVIASCADLQVATDVQLETVIDELKEVDNVLDNARDHIVSPKED